MGLGAGDQLVLVCGQLQHAARLGALQGYLTGVAGGPYGDALHVQGGQPLVVGDDEGLPVDGGGVVEDADVGVGDYVELRLSSFTE
nr:hypothetical protein OG999_38150 [Streptomyces sp. NBC_00886]